MTTISILQLLGIPAIFSAAIIAVATNFAKRIKENDTETQAVKSGVQALLRAQMISEYNKAKDKGYAPIYAKENFQNMWDNYHNLGANGVMDAIKDEYLAMPTNRKEEIEQ